MAFFGADDIAHDSTLTVEGADDYLFGLLSSDMFMTWVRTVAGRLKSDFRVSAEMVYNTFSWPDPDATARDRVAKAARVVLDVRDAHAGETLASLYDPRYMPTDLLAAHRELDRVVVRLFAPRAALATELARQEALFARYVELTQQLQ
jgi:hypothetical protein